MMKGVYRRRRTAIFDDLAGGDLAMWDNYSAVHCAIGDFEQYERCPMHRTTHACPALAAT